MGVVAGDINLFHQEYDKDKDIRLKCPAIEV